MKKTVHIYCRKSSEGEERQALSIRSQIEELKKVAKRDSLKVEQILTESKSAKIPGRRPIFDDLLKEVSKGNAKTLLVWNLDRLSRNSVDTGKLIYLMDQNKLNEIITPSQIFTNTPNDKFLLSIMGGQAKLENDNRGINAKRGMNTKARMGWYPQHAPIGYKNTPYLEKGLKIIVKDPQRFPIIQRCFKEVINGKSASDIYHLAVNDWHLTNPRTGRAIAKSTFYKFLNNPFYYGDYKWNDEWHTGKHPSAITRDEFDIVQRMLGHKGKPIQRSHTFDLTGLFKCKQCGCSLTATKKTKYYKTTKHHAEYIYYHCTKKNKHIKCSQKPISESKMVDAIVERLLEVQPSQKFIDWAKKWIKYLHEHESRFQESILKNDHKELENIENRLNKLLDLYINDGIDQEKYKAKKSELEQHKLDLKKKLTNTDSNLTNWREKVEDTLDFARVVSKRFKYGDRETRHQILLKISSDLVYESKNPLIYLKKEYKPLKKLNKKEYKEDCLARTSKYTDIFVKRPNLRPTNPMWLLG